MCRERECEIMALGTGNLKVMGDPQSCCALRHDMEDPKEIA